MLKGGREKSVYMKGTRALSSLPRTRGVKELAQYKGSFSRWEQAWPHHNQTITKFSSCNSWALSVSFVHL